MPGVKTCRKKKPSRTRTRCISRSAKKQINLRKTLKGGWINLKKLDELTVDKLLQKYGKKKNFLGRYSEYTDKDQIQKDNNVLLSLSHEKKTELCDAIAKHNVEPNLYLVNSAIGCSSTRAHSPPKEKPNQGRPLPSPPKTHRQHESSQIYDNPNYNDSDDPINNYIHKILPSIIINIQTNPLYSYYNSNYSIIVFTKNDNEEIVSVINNNKSHEILRYKLGKCENKSYRAEVLAKCESNNSNPAGSFYFYKNYLGQYFICPGVINARDCDTNIKLIPINYSGPMFNEIKYHILPQWYDYKKPTFVPICNNEEIKIPKEVIYNRLFRRNYTQQPVSTSYASLRRQQRSNLPEYATVKPNTSQEQRTPSGYQEPLQENRAVSVYAEPNLGNPGTSHYHGPHVPKNATAYEGVNLGNTSSPKGTNTKKNESQKYQKLFEHLYSQVSKTGRGKTQNPNKS